MKAAIVARSSSPLGGVGVRDRIAHLIGGVLVTGIAVLLLLPAVMVVAQSFSNDTFFSFPPSSWGLRQYETLIGQERWTDALLASVRVAGLVAVLAAAITVPAVFAFHRSTLRFRSAVFAGGVAGLIIPVSAYAVALYGVFVQFGILGTQLGVVIAHTTLAVPVTLLVTASAMSRLPVELELAAMVAGASRVRAWTSVTLRLVMPALLAGALLAFITSFDEAVLVVFLGGRGVETLPRAVLNSLRIGIDPVITAIATLLIVATSAVMLTALMLGRDGEKEARDVDV